MIQYVHKSSIKNNIQFIGKSPILGKYMAHRIFYENNYNHYLIDKKYYKKNILTCENVKNKLSTQIVLSNYLTSLIVYNDLNDLLK